MSRPILGLTGFAVVAMLVGGSLTYGRGVGGRGGGGFSSRSVARTSVNRNFSNTNVNRNFSNTNVNRNFSNTNVNRNFNNVNVNRNLNNVNVNRNFDFDRDIDVDVNHRYGGWGYGCCYHPGVTAAAATAAAVTTAAVVGSVVHSLPTACETVVVNGFTYQQCGSTWYQPQFSGSTVNYIVVNPPR